MKAVALVTPSVLESDIKGWMDDLCAKHGCTIDWVNVTEKDNGYREKFKAYRNVIAWNCRMPHWWMSKWGNNVLSIENSLLHQPSGIFIDSRGFYTNSNLNQLRTWEQSYDVNLDGFCRAKFEWGAMAGGDPDGPVLVCLQSPLDLNMTSQFPAAHGKDRKLQIVMELLYNHLPSGKPVVIRPNPRFLDKWKEAEHEIKLKDEWTVNWEGRFHEILPQFSRLVTVNSTCASEAATLGMPVAALGTGCFTGSGVVLECHSNPSLLSGFYDWVQSTEACRAYACAILGRHFVPYKMNGANVVNVEMERWLAKLK